LEQILLGRGLVRPSAFLAPLIGLSLLAGCAAEPAGEEGASTDEAIVSSMQAGAATAFPEAVQILMGNGVDYCTGVLVSPTVVLGAAHCIWGTAYTVKAPFAPGAPSRKVVRSKVLSRGYSNDAASPDVGMLVLDAPIKLAQYGVLTSIGAEADRGTSFQGVAVGRSREARTAPLVRSTVLTITSGQSAGYDTGLHTPYYSTGGDSGGPLFLVEGGRVTHKVVAVERQPDPANDADWFTRVDAAVLALVHP
jgi:secreted trypsin-like serine protease